MRKLALVLAGGTAALALFATGGPLSLSSGVVSGATATFGGTDRGGWTLTVNVVPDPLSIGPAGIPNASPVYDSRVTIDYKDGYGECKGSSYASFKDDAAMTSGTLSPVSVICTSTSNPYAQTVYSVGVTWSEAGSLGSSESTSFVGVARPADAALTLDWSNGAVWSAT